MKNDSHKNVLICLKDGLYYLNYIRILPFDTAV